MNKTELEILAEQFSEQVLELEKTVRKLSPLARQQDVHDVKWIVLTEIHSGHFGNNGLPDRATQLVKMLQPKKG